jgi:HSP20 family molecular chaperone IbpA
MRALDWTASGCPKPWESSRREAWSRRAETIRSSARRSPTVSCDRCRREAPSNISLQRELEARFASDWLSDLTTSRGPFPPINVFQQGDDILAIIELPGVDKNDLQIQAKANTIRISGKKNVGTPTAPACIAVNASPANLIARCRCRSNSIPMASRPSIGTAFSPCSCPGRRATSRAASRSSDRLS